MRMNEMLRIETDEKKIIIRARQYLELTETYYANLFCDGTFMSFDNARAITDVRVWMFIYFGVLNTFKYRKRISYCKLYSGSSEAKIFVIRLHITCKHLNVEIFKNVDCSFKTWAHAQVSTVL